MVEPTDSQDAYDYLFHAFELSEKYQLPVLYRVTTRVCHSKCVLNRSREHKELKPTHYERNVKQTVMIPAFARLAHRSLRAKLHEAEEQNNAGFLVEEKTGSPDLGIIATGISYQHALDAAPEASFLKTLVSNTLKTPKTTLWKILILQ